MAEDPGFGLLVQPRTAPLLRHSHRAGFPVVTVARRFQVSRRQFGTIGLLDCFAPPLRGCDRVSRLTQDCVRRCELVLG